MNPQKTAILVDSCMDVPQEYVERFNMYVVPVRVIYRDREYADRVDITPREVYDRLSIEVPKTSLPDTGSVIGAFDAIVAAGYERVLCITISSALSGTNGLVNLVARDYPQLEIRVVDTLNIGIAAGFQAILAASLLEAGEWLHGIAEKVEASVKETKVFFCLSTLDYLRRGGRIGKVSAMLGSLLNIKPIITCNAEGAYVVASKVRGRAQAVAETIAIAVREAKKHVKYRLAIANGDADEDARHVMAELKRLLPDCGDIIVSDVSPALVVHTGPGLIGIGVQALPA